VPPIRRSLFDVPLPPLPFWLQGILRARRKPGGRYSPPFLLGQSTLTQVSFILPRPQLAIARPPWAYGRICFNLFHGTIEARTLQGLEINSCAKRRPPLLLSMLGTPFFFSDRKIIRHLLSSSALYDVRFYFFETHILSLIVRRPRSLFWFCVQKKCLCRRLAHVARFFLV